MYDFLDKIGLKAVLEVIKGKMPTSLPANGGNADYATNAGNADTLDGLHANDFITSQAIQHLTTIDDCITAGTYAVSTVYTTDMPTIYGMWGICDVRTYGLGIFQTIKYTDTAIVICRSKIEGQIEWAKWKEISTTPIKSVEVGGTTDAYGNFMIWKASSNRIPIYAKIAGYYVFPFLIFTADDYYYYLGVCDATSHEWVANTAVSGTVYYIEI